MDQILGAAHIRALPDHDPDHEAAERRDAASYLARIVVKLDRCAGKGCGDGHDKHVEAPQDALDTLGLTAADCARKAA